MLVTRRASPRRNLEQGIDSYRVSTPFGQIGSLCPQSDLKAFRFPRNSLLTEAVQVSLSRATIFCKSASHFLTRTVACRAARRQKNLPKEIFLTSYPTGIRTNPTTTPPLNITSIVAGGVIFWRLYYPVQLNSKIEKSSKPTLLFWLMSAGGSESPPLVCHQKIRIEKSIKLTEPSRLRSDG